MVTRRAALVGVVGLCFYLIALVNQLPGYYYSLTWLTACVLASSLAIALLSLIGLDCQWHAEDSLVSEALPAPEASSEGIDAAVGPPVELRFQNSGTLNKTGVRIDISLEPSRSPRQLERRFLLGALPSGNSLETTVMLQDLPRGKYRVSGLRLIGSDALGLFRMTRRITVIKPDLVDAGAEAETGEPRIVVGPALVSLARTPGATVGAGRQGGVQSLRVKGQGDELRGIRTYNPGDDLRRVHWRSTARLGKLVVREFEQVVDGCNVVVWDGAPVAPADPADQALATEWGLRLVASLCQAFIEAGEPCLLLRLDRHCLQVPLGSAPGLHGQSPLLGHVLEALAEADNERDVPLSEALRRFLPQLLAGSKIFIVSCSIDDDLAHCVGRCALAGVDVAVGLVDAAAVVPPPAAQARRRRGPGSGADVTERADDTPGNESGGAGHPFHRRRSLAASAQAHQQHISLHDASALVVALEPLGRCSPAAGIQPLQLAMRQMLGLEEANVVSPPYQGEAGGGDPS